MEQELLSSYQDCYKSLQIQNTLQDFHQILSLLYKQHLHPTKLVLTDVISTNSVMFCFNQLQD